MTGLLAIIIEALFKLIDKINTITYLQEVLFKLTDRINTITYLQDK